MMEEAPEATGKYFAAMADYFSPAVTALQRYLGLRTQDVFYSLGQTFGQKAAEKFASWSLLDILSGLARAWELHGMGRLDVDTTDPLTLTIRDCVVCGQVAGTGDMFSCAFHEGFFQALLSAKLGRRIQVRQEANFGGAAGTWCRRLVADVGIHHTRAGVMIVRRD